MPSKKDQNHRRGPRPGGAEKMMKTFEKIYNRPPSEKLLKMLKGHASKKKVKVG